MRILLCLALLLSASCGDQTRSPKPPSGMVSSAHPLATEAGLEVLRSGGNAFDAAVAVAATLNVVEPMMSGMGGYGTILTFEAPSRRIQFLNASGRIPQNVNADLFREPTPGYRENRRGPMAVSTPGNVNAWKALSEKGRLPWRSLFSDSIRIAREGFQIDERTARLIASGFAEFPDHAKSFYGIEDRPLAKGERLIQVDLARSLEMIANEGAEALHGGLLGKRIDAEMRKQGGFLTISDLKQNEAEWRDPIQIEYRGFQVFTASPPATAFPSLVRLGLMSQFDVSGMDHNSVDHLHRFSEVTKHAFWSRLKYAGDPDVVPPPLDRLLSEEYWREQAAQIDLERATPFSPPGAVPAGMNTTHFVVADGFGNVVSATQTLGNSFGSRIMAEGTGIWLNNSLAYCTFEPKGNPMDAHAGRRKLSGDCPTIILKNGRLWAALGTPGGHTIGQTVPQMVMNLIDFQMSIEDAIRAPRISFVEPDLIAIEESINEATVAALEARGHKVRRVRALGNAHGLRVDWDEDGNPRFTGAADPRGVGLARAIANENGPKK